MKRGLAVSAVSALALTGLAMSPAQARTILDGETVPVELYSQASGDIGVRNDGTNTTVTLAAASDDASTNSFVFYSVDGGVETEIADVPAIEGYGTYQWTPPVGTELDDIDEILVEAERNDDSLVGSDSKPIGTNTVSNNEVVNLTGNDGAALGVYDGRATVTGLSTDPATTTFEIAGPESAPGAVPVVEIGDPTGNGTPVAANVAVGSNDTGDANDDVIARGVIAGQSDDVQVYELYDQAITTVTKATAPGFPANVVAPDTNEQVRWVISVKDQSGAPITGAEIFESDASGVPAEGIAEPLGGGDFDFDVTDELGQLTIQLDEECGFFDFRCLDSALDRNPASAVGATYVVLDKNQDGDFDNGLDQIIELNISRLPVSAVNLEVRSSLGNAMDADEDTNVTVVATDANGDPIQDLTIALKADRDVADNSPADATENFGTDDTNASGVANFGSIQPGIDLNAVDVKFTATAGAATGTLDIETDEAEVVWDNAPRAQALANTDTTQSGVVQLPSGTPLPNRHVEIDLNPTDNTLLSPAIEQPAGTVRGGDEIADATTSATGTFAVKIDDPASPVGQELDNEVIATFDDSGDFPSDTLDLDWLRSLTPVRVNIFRGIGTSDTDGLPSGFGGDLRPGGLGVGNVRAFNSDNVELTHVDVTVTIDEGFFVDPTDPYEATPAPGGVVDFKSAGKTMTVNTGGGAGVFLVNIERNTGFDDNGLVSDKLHASVAGQTDTHDLTWSTQNIPLNPRATDPLVVALSADQDSSILPKARAGDTTGSGQTVDYDVFAYDQFGNPVSQDIDVTDNTPVADFVHPTSDDSQYALSQPAIEAYADSATSQSLEVELDQAVKTVYVDDVSTSAFDPADPDADIAVVQPVDIEKSTAAINWYELNLAASTFSLGQQGPNTVPVGTSVTEVFTAVDQESQYIQGLTVDFLRSGPGDEDDDSCAEDLDNGCAFTNAKGKAFLDFSGGARGAANVSAVVFEDDGTRFGKVAEDTVRFGGVVTNAINPSIKGKNNGGADDKIKVKAAKADGATVQLYKLANGKRTLVQTKKMNADGVVRFSVNDLNGAGVTTYKAVVRATGDTQRGATQRRQVR